MVTASNARPVRRARISSLATYVPPRLLTNADLEKMVDTSDEWIRQRTGIITRHRAAAAPRPVYPPPRPAENTSIPKPTLAILTVRSWICPLFSAALSALIIPTPETVRVVE